MDMSLGSISGSEYASMVNQSGTNALTTSLKNIDGTSASDDEMMDACKEFEAYMIEQVYKQMESTIMKSDDEENDYEEYFSDLRIQEFAKSASEQGSFGLAQQLYDAMKAQSQTIDPGTL